MQVVVQNSSTPLQRSGSLGRKVVIFWMENGKVSSLMAQICITKKIDEANVHPAKAGCISACHPRSSLHCKMRIGYQPCAFSEQRKCCRSRPRPTHRRMAHKSCWQKAGSQNCKRRIHNLVLATPSGHKSCRVRQGLSDI